VGSQCHPAVSLTLDRRRLAGKPAGFRNRCRRVRRVSIIRPWRALGVQPPQHVRFQKMAIHRSPRSAG